jgi:hypothetical protein
MRLLICALLAFLAVACGSGGASRTSTPASTLEPALTVTPRPTMPAGTPVPTPSGRSGIIGTASVGPTCPVQRIDSPCPDRPFEGTIVALDARGREVARTTSDAQGRFTISLPPGNYVISALVSGPLPLPKPVNVTVAPGLFVRVELHLDSGIR